MSLTIKTNNVPRETFSGMLADMYVGEAKAKKLREQFDYLTDEEFEVTDFIQYRGYFYSLGDFMRASDDATGDLSGWDGYASDSFFSGVCIKFHDSPYGEVIVGRYYC